MVEQWLFNDKQEVIDGLKKYLGLGNVLFAEQSEYKLQTDDLNEYNNKQQSFKQMLTEAQDYLFEREEINKQQKKFQNIQIMKSNIKYPESTNDPVLSSLQQSQIKHQQQPQQQQQQLINDDNQINSLKDDYINAKDETKDNEDSSSDSGKTASLGNESDISDDSDDSDDSNDSNDILTKDDNKIKNRYLNLVFINLYRKETMPQKSDELQYIYNPTETIENDIQNEITQENEIIEKKDSTEEKKEESVEDDHGAAKMTYFKRKDTDDDDNDRNDNSKPYSNFNHFFGSSFTLNSNAQSNQNNNNNNNNQQKNQSSKVNNFSSMPKINTFSQFMTECANNYLELAPQVCTFVCLFVCFFFFFFFQINFF